MLTANLAVVCVVRVGDDAQVTVPVEPVTVAVCVGGRTAGTITRGTILQTGVLVRRAK